MLEKLKRSLGLTGDEEDGLLKDIVSDATALYLSLKYPYTQYPKDDDGEPLLDFIAKSWIIRATEEMYSKQGAEGQTGHSENSIGRTWSTGTISQSLIAEIQSTSGIY